MKNLFFSCLLLLSGYSYAQQPLNLDFEMKTAKGANRAWGWDDAEVDSTVAHHGKYSLQVKGQSAVCYLEPYFLKRKRVNIKGWVQNGSVTIKLEWDNGFDSIRTAQSKGWQNFSLTGKIPDTINWVRISITGKAWVDDLSLFVNGKKVTALPAAPAFTKSQMNWLDSSSFSSDNYLKKFKEIAGDARIIALGEATHGTSEFFKMKHRLLEYAVQEMDVRIFAIEDHQLVVEKVNKYVLGDTGTARKSMYGMFSVWDNDEVYNMIKWVRSYNDQHPDDKVEFTGFDMQSLKQPQDSLYSFLKKKDTSLLKTKAEEIFDIIFPKRKEWLSAAKNRNDSLYIEWGIQYARLVKQFARESIDPMALYRDEAMAENISWMLSIRKPGTRMLIWAHDVHISRGEHPQKELNYHNAISMGSWLAKKYGSQYKAFGISSYTGAYRAYPDYTDYSKWISCPLCPGPVGSLDHALHTIAIKRKQPSLLLDLRNARKQSWLSAPLPVRFANHVCYEYAYWTRFSIPYQFDGIIFIDETSPAKKIRE